ncbi:hypothetical protein FOCC_FOCC016172 [Frankliniella occidentalis]|uniref:Uncharacterized protein LOC127751438 n=1 Tax=Frankliniella occidentalis TaxID=133901 RepID=A0A9C6XUE8_FRAOC|nr:uncharacterized protein LOC127751438 [Frankliniella occidentalis]KAE8738352.1 hypothetical protein FOCC_FOCC016172 [Frankliniella occidentalis]
MKGGFKSSGPGPSRRYCLVKWLSGRDVGTLTHNLDLDWVKDFEESDDYRVESHVIEWRVPPMPKSGWPLFDGEILEISDDLDFLKLRMEQEETALQLGRKEKEKEKQKGKENSNTPPASTPRGRPLQEMNSRSDGIGIEDVQKLICSLISGAKKTSTPSESLVEETLVKVGEVLQIKKSALMEAKLARSPTAMTVELVRIAFSEDRRRKSSYAGQVRTRNGIRVQKPSLKKYRKMKDIQSKFLSYLYTLCYGMQSLSSKLYFLLNFVKERFPHFSQAHFGQAVNSCLGKNVDAKPQKEYVDESDEEGGL